MKVKKEPERPPCGTCGKPATCIVTVDVRTWSSRRIVKLRSIGRRAIDRAEQ